MNEGMADYILLVPVLDGNNERMYALMNKWMNE